MSDAEVYRKAAEVIVRDGKTEGSLTEFGDHPENIKDPSIPVCAIGACHRAHYELYGVVPPKMSDIGGERIFTYEFPVQDGEHRSRIWRVNDRKGVSAEDIALLLKRRAEEIEGR